MKNFLWLISITPILCFAQEYVDNTNSAGLSSMQRAIDAQDIPRMEGLIKGGAGYHWWVLGRDGWGTEEKAPLINYAISNNKPKAIDFLLGKQTAADASTVILAMEKTNYTLVKTLIDEYLSFETMHAYTPQIQNTGHFTNITENVPVKVYHSHWQANYTLSNKSSEEQNFKANLGTNIYKSLEKQITKIMKEQKQKGKLVEYSSNSIGIITNTVMQAQQKNVEILVTNIITNSTNVFVSYNLGGEKCNELARLAAAQSSLPMVDYFLDKGADINEGLLHLAVYHAHTVMVKHLLSKGADALKDYDVQALLGSYDNETHTPTFVVEYILEDIAKAPERIQEYKKLLRQEFLSENHRNYYEGKIEEEAEKITKNKNKLSAWKEILNILKKYEE